jgi:hypothetical protein
VPVLCATKEPPMRSRQRHLTFISLAFLIAIVLGCQGSSTVTGPSGGAAASTVNIAGSWSGSYQSDDAFGCGGSAATASFQQNGATVTGLVSTSSCGARGYFRGTVQGNMVLGAINMEGCVGGGASGIINGTEMSLSIGDLTKPLVTGDRIVMYGGVVTFHR